MFIFTLPRYQQLALLFGAFLGLSFSALLFFTVPAYHALVVWSWTTPWVWAIGLPVGIILGRLTD